ncbi:SDR family oxidoreductase [Sphingomonas sp. GB1N7]|uniref:SDR family oxidoreductase n=1 Tax=Parasphingomonas caseinilytica TaxID=3096158 RepID=UPI002FC71808
MGKIKGGRIEGKIALVTGGASGLGEAIVRRFADEGAALVIADIDVASGTALAAELGARFVKLDVSIEQDWIDALATCDRIDILVNNAGITTHGSIEDLTLAQFRHEFDVDVVGVFLGSKLVIPHMKRRADGSGGGSVINMSSMCGVKAQADLAGYNAAKAAVTHLSKSIALHYAKSGYGMRCNSVHPGAIHTPILDKVMAQVADGQALYDGWVAGHPIGRLGKPEEIAAMALYLASDEAAFTTGAEFRVDGGSSL